MALICIERLTAKGTELSRSVRSRSFIACKNGVLRESCPCVYVNRIRYTEHCESGSSLFLLYIADTLNGND